MAYFNQSFIDFFKGLAKNNSKDYFDDQRKVYEKEVKKPFQQLIADLTDELSKDEPDMKQLAVKDALFRINRDIRFSKEKHPYNLHVSAVVSPYGRKNMQYPGLYLQLSIDKCHFGGGLYMPDKDNLQRMRQYIIDHPKQVEEALNDPAFVQTYGQLSEGERNKVLPREFKDYAEQYPLLFNKQFYFMTEQPGEETIQREDLLPFIASHHRAANKWNTVLKQVVS